MTVSKKKAPGSRRSAPGRSQGSMKSNAPSSRGKTGSAPSARRVSPDKAKKGGKSPATRHAAYPLPPAKGGGTPPRPSPGIEVLLQESREQIRGLIEERDNQAALLEAADVEREILQRQLEQLRERLERMEKDAAHRARPDEEGGGPGREVQLEFVEDEEDAEEEEGGAQVDEVDEIYERMDNPRVRRQELDRERLDRESEAGDESFWLVCPKCGDNLEEVESEDVKIERCESCSGIYLDRGEVEMLLSLTRGPRGLRRTRNVLQI